MSQISRDQVLKEAKKLADLIREQEDVQIYQKAEAQINKHQRVQDIINQIKLKQQELVNAKHIKKQQYVMQLEKELDALNKELHEIPLVSQYQQSQRDINKSIQSLIQLMGENLSTTLPIENDTNNSDLSELVQLKP